MAERKPAPTPQEDDSFDDLLKLKLCRRKLREQYHDQVYTVWQWNILIEGLSSAQKLFKLPENENGDTQDETVHQVSAEERKQNLEEILANWERSFSDKIEDGEFKELFKESKILLEKIKEKGTADCTDLSEIENNIILSKIQRQYLSKKCGNVSIHWIYSLIKKLFVRCKRVQSEKEKSDKSFLEDVSKVTKFVCPKNNPLLNNLQIIFPEGREKNPEGQRNCAPTDVASLTRACADLHERLIIVSHLDMVNKSSVELYDKLKKMLKNKDSSPNQSDIGKIIAEFTGKFVYFFEKLVLFIEEINRCLQDKKLKDKSDTLRSSFYCFREKLKEMGLQFSDVSSSHKEELSDILTAGQSFSILTEMGLQFSDVSASHKGLKIAKELSHILTAGQSFSMLTECHHKVNKLIQLRINLEKDGNVTTQERRVKCKKAAENCSASLNDFLKSIKEKVVPCEMCKKYKEANEALRNRNLLEERRSDILSILRPVYSSQEWQEIRMLKEVVDCLRRGPKIEAEPRKYLFNLLKKWHENCTKSVEFETCKMAKEALESEDIMYLSLKEQRFILDKLKFKEDIDNCEKAKKALESGDRLRLSSEEECFILKILEKKKDPLYKKTSKSFGEKLVDSNLKQHLLETVTKWYDNFKEYLLYEEAVTVLREIPLERNTTENATINTTENATRNTTENATRNATKLRRQLLETVTKWYNNFKETGSFTTEEVAHQRHQELVNIYEAYEALKSYKVDESLPEEVHSFLLTAALSNPSECQDCEKVLRLSETFEDLLGSKELREEQRKYLEEEVFPETATCSSCTGIRFHLKSEQSEKKYWEKLESYLKTAEDCENCQDILQCMKVFNILKDKKELKEDESESLKNLLRKLEDKWNCREEFNCIRAAELLSKKTEENEEVRAAEEYVRKKLKKEKPCEYDQDSLHTSQEAPSRTELRDFLLKNPCQSCYILMAQFKVRKTLEENKFLSNNLCETMVTEVFPKTVQCKECHQWLDCIKTVEATGTLSEGHKEWINHILNSTAGCKGCACAGEMDTPKLKEILFKEGATAESDFMKAIKDCRDRAIYCKECHRRLIHIENPKWEIKTEENDRLKKFIAKYLKQYEHRLHCEVCEIFFVPENPIFLGPLPLNALDITKSGCSREKDVKSFREAAGDQLKEQSGSLLEDTFIYPSNTRIRRKSCGNVNSTQGTAPRKSSKRDRKKRRKSSGNTDAGCSKGKGETPSLQADAHQQKKQASCPKGKNRKRNGKDQVDGTVTAVEGAKGSIKDETGTEDKTRSEPCPGTSVPGSTPQAGDSRKTGPASFARNNSRQDVNESEGVNEVVGIFQDWAQENNVPLCILKNYNYGKLEGVLEDFRSPMTKSDGEFDILMISRHLGVILVELKAAECQSTTHKASLGKAQVQLEKNKMVFFEINKDWLCPSRVPVISLIAVPNITCQQLKDYGICSRDRQRILTKCRIQYLQKNPRELDKLIGIPTLKYVFSDDEYCTLLARFFGLKHLIKRHCINEGLIRDTGRKMLGMLLTEDQKSLIHSGGNAFQILAGDYGTGKSLMLTEKAKLIANSYKKMPKKKKIFLISCTDITVDGEYLKKGQPDDSVLHLCHFTGDKSKEREFDYFDHIDFHLVGSFIQEYSGGNQVSDLEAAIVAVASGADTELHFLFDEMPLNFMKTFKKSIESLIEAHKSVLKTFWVSIATHSFRVTVLKNQDPTWIKEDCPYEFPFRYLRKNLRVPGRVLDLHKAIEWFNGDGHVDTKRGDIPQGPWPLLYRVPVCICNSNSKTPLSCECSQRRVKETLKTLFIKIGILEEKDGTTAISGKTWPRSITMLLFAVESQSFCCEIRKILLESCKELGIGVEDRTYVKPNRDGRSQEASGGCHCISDGTEDVFRDGDNLSLQPQKDEDKTCSFTSGQASSLFSPSKNSNENDKESQSQQKILLTTETSFIGCESEVLICVDLNGMLHWYPNGKLAYTTSGISRCLSQYIHLTWMPTEAKTMFREQMAHCGDVTKEDIDKALQRPITCLESVLNQRFIIEQRVEMPTE